MIGEAYTVSGKKEEEVLKKEISYNNVPKLMPWMTV